MALGSAGSNPDPLGDHPDDHRRDRSWPLRGTRSRAPRLHVEGREIEGAGVAPESLDRLEGGRLACAPLDRPEPLLRRGSGGGAQPGPGELTGGVILAAAAWPRRFLVRALDGLTPGRTNLGQLSNEVLACDRRSWRYGRAAVRIRRLLSQWRPPTPTCTWRGARPFASARPSASFTPRLRRHIEARLELVPRFRRRLAYHRRAWASGPSGSTIPTSTCRATCSSSASRTPSSTTAASRSSATASSRAVAARSSALGRSGSPRGSGRTLRHPRARAPRARRREVGARGRPAPPGHGSRAPRRPVQRQAQPPPGTARLAAEAIASRAVSR